jgi:outer membrane protein TolC
LSTWLSGFISLHGQDSEVYDLKTFLAHVVNHSKDLKLAKKELDLAKVNKKEALSTALPKIGIDANYNRNLKENFLYIDFPDFETGEMTNQKFKINYKNEYGLSAVLNQTLFSFKVGTALRAAKEYKILTNFVYNATHQTIMTMAKKGFYQALLLKKVWEVCKASEENARENYLNMKKRFANGQISEFNLLQSEVRWQNLMPETTKAERNHQMALNTLKILAGIPVEKTIELEGSFDLVPTIPDPISLDLVLERRPDFNALLWEKKLLKTNVRAQSAERYPNLSVNLIYNFSSLSDYFKFERQNKSYIIGLNLSIPVFTGGYRQAQVQRAKIQVEKTGLRIDKEKETILHEMQNIRLRLKEAHKRMISAEKSRQTAEKAFKIAEITAANGLATQLELKDARVLYDQAKLNVYVSTYDYLDAYYDWQQAAGELL